MKALLTILFFADTVALICLSFLLLKMLDKGGCGFSVAVTLMAYMGCLFLLGYLFFRYMKLPVNKKTPSIFE